MLNNDKECYEEIELLRQVLNIEKEKSKINLKDYSAEEIKNALMSSHEISRPLDDLIATIEATFEFIKRTKMKRCTRAAFGQLEKQFDFYRKLVLLKN